MHIQKFSSINLKKVGSIILTLICIFVIFIVLLVAAGPYFGIRTNIVISGSMEPAIGTGSVIITRPIAPENIRVGDIISYSSRTGVYEVTHRVIGIEQTPDLHFITKGDANQDKDPTPIPAEQVLGKLFLVIPGLGYLITYMRNPIAIIMLIGIPAIILLWFELDKMWVRGEK